jgi:hypothetical protein
VSGLRLLNWIAGVPVVRVMMGGACSTYGGRREVCAGFWWGNLNERDRWGDPGINVRIILRWIFREWDVGVWTGLSWLRIGTGGGHL